MVQMLASRAAGLKLGRIIAALLIPIGIFSFILISNARHDQQLTRANRDGRMLMDLTLRTMFDIIDGWSAPDHRNDLLARGAALAETAGVSTEFEQMQKSLNSPTVSQHDILQQGAKLMTGISSGAGMNDAGNREANILAGLAGDALPQAIINFEDLHQSAARALFDTDMLDQKMPGISVSVSALEFSARDVAARTLQARASSEVAGDYSRLLQTTWWLKFDAAHLRTVALVPGNANAIKIRDLESNMLTSSHKWVTTLQSVWGDINARLAKISDARQAVLTSSNFRNLAICIAAVVMGLGMAISMFRSTLVQLDELDIARRDAVAARAQAEQSAADLSEMNDGMSRVNGEMVGHLRALRDAQDQLVKKTRMEQMGQLTATIAHELRNPLGAVRTSAFLLERKTRGKDLGIDGQLQRINNGVTRCDAIITQLLDFSRSKQIITASEDFDHWLENVVAEEAQRLPASVSITCQLGLSGLHVPFDGARLQRAIANLVSNASEAMVGSGEGTMRGEISDPTIRIVTQRDGEFVRLDVIDNGPGIKPDDMRRIREPLFTTKNFGTGLGLPAVEQILVQHGGSLQIESEVGHGAKFIVRLPVQQLIEGVA